MGEDSSRREDLVLGRDAFMSSVEAVLDPAYRLATVILLDYGAAEDAVHDATVRAWRQYRRMGGEVTSFRTWFLALVADQCRRVRRWRLLTLRRRGDDFAASGGLRDVLGGLPLASRASLFCFVSLDLPMDEVARILRMSPGRVRSRVYRASERAQVELRREEDTES
jgi:DNA-directed RNA polymerase specialized sigma24 family protein